MCGRFTLTATPEALNQLFPLFEGMDLQPQYNIAPSQNVLAVRQQPGGTDLEAVWLRWGLVPSWADDLKIGYKLANARAETAATKPSFRAAFKSRHCLILADGFYEWQKLDAKHKQPYHIRRGDGMPLAFAGLWEKWEREGEMVESCTILTTAANDGVREIHERMPVMLNTTHQRRWLESGAGEEALKPIPAEQLVAVAVSSHVNNPRHNDPLCLQPLAA
jgi:putative SOS response-associated peptidase YedK